MITTSNTQKISDGPYLIDDYDKHKMPKNYLEAVNQRRTDITMTKRKGNSKTNNDLQNTTLKDKDLTTQAPLQTGGKHRPFRSDDFNLRPVS